jgi:stage IV sporulation protein B
MKKILKFSAFLAVVAVVFSLAVGKIPAEFSCPTGQAPKGNFLYTVEADAEALSQKETGSYTAKVKLFGLLPIKNATIHRIQQKSLVVLGTPFGVKLYTKGVIVVDTEEQSAGVDAGIKEGDIILSYNGAEVRTNEALAAEVQKCGGKRQKAQILRNQRTQNVWVTPKKTADGYSIGLWVRDSTAGLGTLTYYDPQSGMIAGLGHSISDVDTGLTMPVESGTLVAAEINGVRAGQQGDPGELLGALQETKLGTVATNNAAGLFGIATADFSGVRYPIALKEEVQEGEAKILCTVQGTAPKSYTIRITKINNNLSELKNLCLQVTDEELLSLTGGIVQGMSGSPILQNGKIVGAVTHVLISDPTAGYGIFIEKMLASAE